MTAFFERLMKNRFLQQLVGSLFLVSSIKTAVPFRSFTPCFTRLGKSFRPTLFTLSSARNLASKKMSESEGDKAQAAKSSDAAINPNAPTFFDKIISGEVKANIIYDDEQCLAFRDISPQGPVHFLVIPKNKQGLNRLSSATEDHKPLLGHLMFAAQKVAHQEGLVKDGYRLVINDGPYGCQSVYHLHIHVIGGRQMAWPPG
jgi:histidine triad (HIT) family protein